MKNFLKVLLVVVCFILFGCAAQKPHNNAVHHYGALCVGCTLEPVPNHPGIFYGPEHLECDAHGECAVVRDWVTADGRQILSPLGCGMKKLYLLQVFWIGDKHKPVCESEAKDK